MSNCLFSLSSAQVEETSISTSQNPEVNDFSGAKADLQSGQHWSFRTAGRPAVKSLKHYQNVKAPTTGAKEFK